MTSQTNSERRPYELLQTIVEQAGPRPAGSEGESRFLDFAEGFFADRGLATRRQAVPNVPSSMPMLPLLITGVLGLLAVTWALPTAPWWLWVYAVVFMALPHLIGRVRRKVTQSGTTGYNLEATLAPARQRKRTLLLCAHHDTARAARVLSPKLGELARNLMQIWPAIVLALTALAVIRIIDMGLAFAPFSWWIVLRYVLLALLAAWGLFILSYSAASRGKRFSPGANDNGSGVAVLMSVGESLAAELLDATEVRIVLFSAEENGLLGSEQYVKAEREHLIDAAVLNLDMVGSGERLSFVTGSGMLPPRRTTPRLNALLQRVAPGIRGRWYSMGNSDFYSFLAKNVTAASLEASGKGRESVYHTERDTMDYIEPRLLGETAELVLAFAHALDAESAGAQA